MIAHRSARRWPSLRPGWRAGTAIGLVLATSAAGSLSTPSREAAASTALEKVPALQLAASQIAAGDPRAAEQTLLGVVDRFDSVRALLLLARLQAQGGDPAATLETLRRALELAPNSEEVLSAFARTSLAAREPVPAIRTLEPLTRMHPTVAEHPYLLGIAQMQIGENESATKALERSLRLAPDRPQTLTALGLALNQQKRFDEARTVLERSLQIEPQSPEALAALAEAEEGLGEHADAEKHARQVLAAVGSHAGAHLVIGKVRMNERRYAEARDALERSIAADPTSAKAHYQLSLAHARLGDAESSARHLERYRATLRQAEEYLIELRTQAGLGVSGMRR